MIIDLLFAFINFAIMAMIIIYAIRRYGVPRLRESIAGEHTALKMLDAEHNQLVKDQMKLEESIVYQEEKAKYLFKQINHWRNTIDLENEARRDNHEKLLRRAHEKILIQSKHYVFHETYKAVVPRVLDNLKRDLTKTYSNPQRAHEYMKSVLADIQKRSL